MRKIIIPLFLLLIIGIISCKKDKVEGVNELTGEPEEFSKLSPEEHKTNLQDVGIAMAGEMEDLATSEAVQASVYGVSLMAEGMDDSEMKSIQASPASILFELDKLARHQVDATDILLNLTKIKASQEDPETVEEAYAEIAGTYTWDKADEVFEYEEGKNLVIKYPSSKKATSNDAVFTVTEFEWKIFENLEDYDVPSEVPTAISANLTVGGTKVIDIAFSGAYASDGIPTDISASLKIEKFEFSASLKNTDMKDASMEYKLKNDGKQLIALKAGVKGNYAESNIEANTKYIKCDGYDDDGYCIEKEVTKNDDYDWEEVLIEKILEKSYGFIEVMNLRVGGEIDVKNLAPKIRAIEDEEDDNEDDGKAETEKIAAALNAHANFFAAYVDEDKKIADVEFYAREFEYTYETDCEYDWENDEYINCTEETDTEYGIDGRLIFGDDSKVDLETYLEDGFSKFVDAINEFIDAINTTYEDYDVDIDEVDYEEIVDDVY